MMMRRAALLNMMIRGEKKYDMQLNRRILIERQLLTASAASTEYTFILIADNAKRRMNGEMGRCHL